MCTVTFIPKPNGTCLLAMNRDEQRSRLPAPEIKQSYGIQPTFIHPVDPESTGTWIGANSSGILFALLNYYTPTGSVSSNERLSRGLIIPSLLNRGSLIEIRLEVEKINPELYSPFSLVIFDLNTKKIAVFKNDGISITEKINPWNSFFLTSSSINSEEVQNYRLENFELFIKKNQTVDIDCLTDFHHSNEMNRPDARTVSLTLIEATKSLIHFSYFPFAE